MKNTQSEKPLVQFEGKVMLTIAEVAAYTGYSIKYLYKLCSQLKIPHYNPEGGRRLFFCYKELIQWLSKNKVKTTQEILNGNNI